MVFILSPCTMTADLIKSKSFNYQCIKYNAKIVLIAYFSLQSRSLTWFKLSLKDCFYLLSFWTSGPKVTAHVSFFAKFCLSVLLILLTRNTLSINFSNLVVNCGGRNSFPIWKLSHRIPFTPKKGSFWKWPRQSHKSPQLINFQVFLCTCNSIYSSLSKIMWYMRDLLFTFKTSFLNNSI